MSGYLTAKENASAPDTPPANYVRLYAKADGQFYYKGDDGVEHDLIGPQGDPGTSAVITTRQTVRLGAVDASGYANFLSAGAGLNFNIDATPSNLVIDFANGTSDFTSVLTADASNQGSLVASNTNFIHATYVSSSSVTWGSALVPPQYGYAFDRTQGALLNFEGADASTTVLDNFGNTWTANGNAQIDTAQFKFGTSSLLLDGSGDWAESTNFVSLGDGSWEICLWFRPASTGTERSVFAAQNGANVGCVLIHNAAGTLAWRVSSDGSSNNIVSLSTAASLAANTWYRIRMVFDALAGTYRLYLSTDGAAETQQISVSSTARVCSLTKFLIGDGGGAAARGHGWFDGLRFVRCATVTGTQTPSVSAPAITDFPVHWFSIPEMKMYEVTSASVSAGTNPGMTQRNRVFVGEQDTNGSTVTATMNYALRGEFVGESTSVISGQVFTHKIGTTPRNVRIAHINISPDAGYDPGDEVPHYDLPTSAANDRVTSTVIMRNSAKYLRNTGNSLYNKSTGSNVTSVDARWKLRCYASRGW